MKAGAIDSYPLAWPPGWKRAAAGERTRAQFGIGSGPHVKKREVTIGEGAGRVIDELRRMGIPESDVIVSTNVRASLATGLPFSKSANPPDPGAAAYWRDGAHQRVMAIDRYDRVADNLAAIAATIEAMRAIERHGGARILERAFTGFTALPAPGQTTGRGWREVLDFPAMVDVTAELVRERFRRLASIYHPDKAGGDAAKFRELTAARDQALEALGQASGPEEGGP